MSSEIKADKWSPASGTSATIGDSGDTYTIPSGVTLANSGTVTGLPASAINSGTIAAARLGSGTASSSTVLYGDGTFKAEPSGNFVKTSSSGATGQSAGNIDITNCFSSTYQIYRVVGFMTPNADAPVKLNLLTGTDTEVTGSDYVSTERTTYIDNSNGQAQNNYGGSGESYWRLGSADTNADNNSDAYCFDLLFFDPNTNSLSRTYVCGTEAYRNGGSGKLYSGYVALGRNSSADATGLRWRFNGTTIRDYRLSVYGLAQ
jgi:hypothetical protein